MKSQYGAQPDESWIIADWPPALTGVRIGRIAKPIVRTKTIQAEPWPLILLPLKLMAKPLDCGAGDIIARVIGPIGGDAFKKWYKRIFGKGCGCGVRQDALNQRWPL